MPTLSLGMVLLNPYNSSPSDCIIGAICNKNKHKNALLVNKTILPCLLGCSNCLGRCTSAYSVKRSAVGGRHTRFHRLHRHTTFATPQPQLASRTQIKNKSNQQAKITQQKIMPKFVIYFKVFYFPPWEKSAMQQMQANQSERMQSSGDNRCHCTKHTQTSKTNKTKPKKQRKFKKILFLFVNR